LAIGLGSGANPRQHLKTSRTAHAVYRLTGVALEVTKSVLGSGPEDAVNSPGVEPEGTQLPLQCGHVVAAEHPVAVVQQTLAEHPPCLDQRAPRLRAADAVSAKASVFLKGADRRLSPVVETPRRIGRGPESERLEPALQVPDRLALVTGLQRQDLRGAYRNG
jgi:hypothetical protein